MMLWVLLFVVIVLCVGIFVDWYTRVEGFERIPGPKGIYLVGNTFDFLMDSVKLFYVFRLFANEFKNVYKGKLFTKKFAVILNPEDVETVISGSRNTSKGFLYNILKPWLREGLLLSDGNKWHDRRRLLTPAFHFNVLKSYKPIFEEHSKRLVEQLTAEIDKPKTDIFSFLSACTLSAISETAMGTKLDQKDELSKQYKNGIHELGELMVYRGQRFWLYNDTIFSMSQRGRIQKRVLDSIGSFRDSVINKRRQNARNNIKYSESLEDKDGDYRVYKHKRMAMLDLLLQAEKEGEIDDQGIKEEVDTFMFEGHDTTATCLQFTILLLANNPETQEKVYEEIIQILGTSDNAVTTEDLGKMKYLECCIKESLRLYPPVYFFIRRIDHDVHIGEYTLPTGTECGIVAYDLHRRPDQFIEPLQFRPERFLTPPTWHPYAYIPFSAGPRNCIGQKFAMMEVKLMLAALLRRYRFLPVTKPLDLIFIVTFILRVKDPIYVKIESRM